MEKLRSIWNELASGYTVNKQLIASLWEEIAEKYADRNRHHHNISHISYMIEQAMSYKSEIINFDAVLFAIFYHDIIYSNKRNDNEEKSANLAVDRMRNIGVPSEMITKCRDLILATKEHKENGDNDTNYLLDFDLAVLGEEPKTYQEYVKNIRKEHSIYPDFLYKKGRRKVLNHFLSQDRIFKSSIFYNKYEKQARENLTIELQSL